MKKFLFPVAICAMALAMTSCDGYNDKQYEDLFPYGPNQSGEFTQGQTKNLNEAFGCSTSWTSPDPFVATVDANGVMTARHVGQTWIQGQAQGNQYFGVTVKSTVDMFDNPAFNPNDEVSFEDVLKVGGDNYGINGKYFSDGSDVVYVAWPLEQKRANDAEEEICYTQYLVNAYKLLVHPQINEETGEQEVDEDGNPVTYATYKLLESNVVLNLAANDNAAAAADDLVSQLTQWYENINSAATVPGLVVYNNYTVDTASMKVSVFGYNLPNMVMVNYSVASSTVTYSQLQYVKDTILAIGQ